MAPSQTFQDHISELRKRFLWVFLAAAISAGIGYAFRQPIIIALQHPLGAPLFFTSPAGSFNFILKLSMVIGMFIALPVAIYQLLRFIEPALPIPIKRSLMAKIIGASFALAVAGACFGFFLMIPLSLKFFLGYSSAQIKPLITANEYLTFVLNHMLTFAVAFQIPMIFLFINRIKPLKPSQLLKYQRHIIVGAFALAIVLPFTYDPLSQFIVAIPIVFLYYLSVLLLWIVNRRRTYPSDVPAAEAPDRPIASSPATKPAPLFEPIPQIRPQFKMAAIDGFVRAPHNSVTQTASSLPQVPVIQPVNAISKQHPHKLGRPRFTIDGISPQLTS